MNRSPAVYAAFAISGVAGFLLPGNRIDILLTRTNLGNAETRLLMQNIEIIAIDQITDRDRTAARVGRTATLEVTSEQARSLALATQIGSLTLTLRGFGSDEITSDEIIDQRTLLGLPEPDAGFR